MIDRLSKTLCYEHIVRISAIDNTLCTMDSPISQTLTTRTKFWIMLTNSLFMFCYRKQLFSQNENSAP